MARYKVPQDVEAEDKLLGPFTFRQFIYLIVASLGIFMAWGLSRIFIGLVIIPLPIIAFFLILALPIKKDQPMEIYLTAVIRFWLKPRRRLWDPEGALVNVEITTPTTFDQRLTKDFSGAEASERLSYLAQIIDTGGWASRGLTSATANVSLSDTLIAEAQNAEDMLDTTANVSQNLEGMIERTDATNKQAVIDHMRAALQPAPPPVVTAPQPITPATPATPPTPPPVTRSMNDDTLSTAVVFDPYPSAIHQRVISPTPATPAITDQPQQVSTSTDTVSPDIIRLATNTDLSISTIAHEAQRLRDKESNDEVVVSFR